MNVLFYIPEAEEANERMHEVVAMIASKATVEIFSSIEHLSRRLRQPGNSPSIATLLVHDRNDLFELTKFRDLLSELPLIIILPDRKKSNVAIGHSLSPRFLTYTDSDFLEVGTVVMKMVENFRRKQVEKEWHNIWKKSSATQQLTKGAHYENLKKTIF